MIWIKMAALLVFYLALAKAVAMDLQYQKVRRYVWWIALAAGGIVFLTSTFRGGPARGVLLDLMIFALLQYGLFSKMYGLADCHAFVACSVVLGAYGGRLREYLIHMLFTIILLGGVQLGKRNVTSRGNLRRPVAFIPYIATCFYLTLLWQNYS